jgi:polyisoprenoid-binding protein YceI
MQMRQSIETRQRPGTVALYEIDPEHSSAQFSVRHLMVANVRGELGRVTGFVFFDEANIARSRVSAVIDVTTIRTRNPKRDTHLRSSDFLDVERHPTITFTSGEIRIAPEGRLRVHGDLTIRGVTRPVPLSVALSDEINDGDGRLVRGVTARTRINRKDFGVAWNGSLDGGGVVVADIVDVTIELELARKSS